MSSASMPSVVRGRLVGPVDSWSRVFVEVTLYGATGQSVASRRVRASRDGSFEVAVGESAPPSPGAAGRAGAKGPAQKGARDTAGSLVTLRIRAVSGDEEIGAVGPLYRRRLPASFDVPVRPRPMFDRLAAALESEAGPLADVLPALFEGEGPSGAGTPSAARVEHLARTIDLPADALRCFAETWMEHRRSPGGPAHETLFAMRCPLPVSGKSPESPADRIEAAIAANQVRSRVKRRADALREQAATERERAAREELERRVAERADRPGEQGPSLADVMDAAGLPRAEVAARRAIARVSLERAPIAPDERLRRVREEIGAARAKKVNLSLALRRMDLAQHLATTLDLDAPLLAALMKEIGGLVTAALAGAAGPASTPSADADADIEIAGRRLAELGRGAWAALVAAGSSGSGESSTPAGIAARAGALAGRFERAHPQEALLAALSDPKTNAGSDSRALFADLRALLSTPDSASPPRLTARWKDDAALREAVAGVVRGRGKKVTALRADRVDALQALERLLYIAPPSLAASLLAGGYRTLRAVACADPDALAEGLAARSGQAAGSVAAQALRVESDGIHARAERAVALSCAIATAAGVTPSTSQSTTGIFQGSPSITGGLPFSGTFLEKPSSPTYEVLFGSPDACAVPAPLTVLGEAAYLVDLLDFLRYAAPGGAGVAQGRLLVELRRRRPDVWATRLSEANATTLLPTIDLVSEQMDRLIWPLAPALQTTWTSAELSAGPEHESPASTDLLRRTGWPWTLPIDLLAVELDGWLGAIGWSRARAERLLAAADAAACSRVEARLSLGLSRAEWRWVSDGMPVLTVNALPAPPAPPSAVALPASGSAASDSAAEAHVDTPPGMVPVSEAVRALHGGEVIRTRRGGLSSPVWLVRSMLAGTSQDIVLAPWHDGADRALDLLDLLGVGLDDLQALLATGFVRGVGAPSLARDAAAPCDLSKARVLGLTPAVRERAVLLLRLRARLGWAMADVDAALRIAGAWAAEPGGHGIAEAKLAQLGAIARLRGGGITLEELEILFPAVESSTPATASAAAGADDPRRAVLLGRAAGRTAAEAEALCAFLPDNPFHCPLSFERWVDASRSLRENALGVPELTQLLGSPPAASSAGADELRAALADTEPGAAARRLAMMLKVRVEVASVLVAKLGPDGASAGEPLVGQVALLARRLDLRGSEVTLDGDRLSILGVLSADDLATDSAPAAPGAAAALLEACRARSLRDRLIRRGVDPGALAEATTVAGALAAWGAVAAALGENTKSVLSLRGGMGLGHPADIARRPAVWTALLDALDALASTGVSAATLLGWAAAEPDAAAIGGARAAVRLLRGEAASSGVARAVAERARTARRDGLLALAGVKLTGKTGAEAAADALAGELLSDPLVNATQRATRIDFAIRAVQSFVERVSLGMERDAAGRLALGEVAKLGWRDLETFAKWRTSREVFLYPEALLRPEIRDEASPLFTEARQLMAGRDLSDENLEDTFARYVNGLDRIARMEVMGACLEDQSGDGATVDLDGLPLFRMHVLARTHGSPHEHYLRVMDGWTGRWEPWRPVALGIDGDWAVPMVRRRRLEIYWVSHSRTLEGLKDVAGLVPAEPFPLQPHLPMVQDQYTLSWAVRRRGEWSDKRSIDQPVARPILPFLPAQFAISEIGASRKWGDRDARLRIAGVTPFAEIPSLHGTLSVIAKAGPPPPPGFDEAVAELESGEQAAKQGFESTVNDLLGLGQQLGDAGAAVFPAADSGLPDAVPLLQGLLEAVNALNAELANGNTTWPVLRAVVSIKKVASGLLDALTAQLPGLATFGNALVGWLQAVSALLGWIRGRAVAIQQKLDELGRLSPEHIARTAFLAGAGMLGASLRWVVGALREVFEGARSRSGLAPLLDTLSGIPGWYGPVPGLEFGFFDLGTDSSRAVRLTPPNKPGIAGADSAYFAVAGAPFHAIEAAAIEGVEQALYTLFPGYPALFDLPVQTGLPAVSLPVLAGEPAIPWPPLPAWPTSGYLVVPFAPTSTLDIAVNVPAALAEDLPPPPSSFLGTDLYTGVEALLQVASEASAIAATGPLGLVQGLLQGIRWVRPLPFEPFPGRNTSPNPSLLMDERRGRTFLLWPRRPLQKPMRGTGVEWSVVQAYHPLARAMASTVDRGGSAGFFARTSREDAPFEPHPAPFTHSFLVSQDIEGSAAAERIETGFRASQAVYNWEILYHLPMFFGDRLRAARQFERALAWYGRIFDPACAAEHDVAPCFGFRHLRAAYESGWRAGPLSRDTVGAWLAWLGRPSDPHAVAAFRERAYAKAAFFRYVGTLVDWADHLWAVDAAGSSAQVTALYLRARELMGRRPQAPPPPPGEARTVGEALSGMSQLGASLSGLAQPEALGASLSGAGAEVLPMGFAAAPSFLVFPVPVDPEVRRMWERIDLGLAKVRAWTGDLPAGPAALVEKGSPATAVPSPRSGGGSAPACPYRFPFLVQKALEQCALARSFSSELLSALASGDGERLALLRQKHEVLLLEAGETVRQMQEAEASAAVTAAESALSGAKIRLDYYASREKRSDTEKLKEVLLGLTAAAQLVAAVSEAAAAALHPGGEVPLRGSGKLAVGDAGGEGQGGGTTGPTFVAKAASAVARASSLAGSLFHLGAEAAGDAAMYERRKQEWDHQADLARNDIAQLDAQLAAAKERLEIARKESVNQKDQKDRAADVRAFLETKVTRAQLYDFLADGLLPLSFDLWQMALQTALQAEQAWRFERLDDRAFIAADGWSDDVSGLLAAEGLERDLRRMEKAWLDDNLRDSPMERRIRLSQHDPVALLSLRQKGRCVIDFPERLFDMDHPGHFMRRLREVRVSIPCVAGPDTPVNLRLSLLAHAIRTGDDPAPEYADQGASAAPPETRFARWPAPLIGGAGPVFPDTPVRELSAGAAISASGQLDWYPRDERYVPFEGAGVISTWSLDLPRETNRFDFDTITDVVFELRYTARRSEDGDFQSAAWTATFGVEPPAEPSPTLPVPAQPRRRLISVRTEAPDAWYAFRTAAGSQRTLEMRLSRDHFPFTPRGRGVEVEEIRIVALTEVAMSGATVALALPGHDVETDGLPGYDFEAVEWSPWAEVGLPAAAWAVEPALAIPEGDGVVVRFAWEGGETAAVRDVLVLVAWTG